MSGLNVFNVGVLVAAVGFIVWDRYMDSKCKHEVTCVHCKKCGKHLSDAPKEEA